MNIENIIFNEEKYTLLLGINKSSVDLNNIRDVASKNGFKEKEEFHTTVIGFKNGGEIKKILEAVPPNKKSYIVYEIKEIMNSIDWSFDVKSEIYHISKEFIFNDYKNNNAKKIENRESYVQMLNMSGIKIFYVKLNYLLDTNFEAPLAHITLFTGGDSDMGIGISTEEEFLKMNPELIIK